MVGIGFCPPLIQRMMIWVKTDLYLWLGERNGSFYSGAELNTSFHLGVVF